MEKPILFNTAMVQAILDGRKSCTRRIIKSQPKKSIVKDTENRKPLAFWKDNLEWVKPPYQVGDTLWVRETWLVADDGLHYKASTSHEGDIIRKEYGYKWRPSIHMPKEAARLFLKVTDVRVERLQDITEDGALKEGIKICLSGGYVLPGSGYDKIGLCHSSAEIAFQVGLKEIYPSIDDNSYVWVIEFKREEK